MFELLGCALYLALIVLCLGVFLNLVWISLAIGGAIGIVVGLIYGFGNYFSSLIEEIRLRK